MSTTTPQETNPGQLDKETFLAHISQIDRDRLRNLENSFSMILHREQKQGALVVVGGTLTKPLPRRDIDILLILGKTTADLDQHNFPNLLQYANTDFEVFRKIAKEITIQNPEFIIGEEIQPFVDPEFDSPNILSHDGSIKIVDPQKQGTPIEIIRIEQRGSPEEVLAKDSRPFIVLASVDSVPSQ